MVKQLYGCQVQFSSLVSKAVTQACVAPATTIRLRGEKEIHDRALVLA
jgi:hypothetical protein